VKGEVLGTIPLPVLLDPPHIKHGLAWVPFIIINSRYNYGKNKINRSSF
jgi:hypothetical protein